MFRDNDQSRKEQEGEGNEGCENPKVTVMQRIKNAAAFMVEMEEELLENSSIDGKKWLPLFEDMALGLIRPNMVLASEIMDIVKQQVSSIAYKTLILVFSELNERRFDGTSKQWMVVLKKWTLSQNTLGNGMVDPENLHSTSSTSHLEPINRMGMADASTLMQKAKINVSLTNFGLIDRFVMIWCF